MNRTELARSKKNYTYGHYLDGKLIYIGEGIRYRGWHMATKPYKDRKDEVEVRIFGVFNSKQLAVFNEGLLIYQERMNGNTALLNKSDCGRGCAGLSTVSLLGEKNPMFKGITVGTNRTTGRTVVFDGEKTMKDRGFSQSCISRCISGHLNTTHHRNFTFIRTTDEDYLRQLLAADNFHDGESKLILQQFLS